MNRGEGYWIAQKLVEHYQPKIPDGSVVLSREEWARLRNLEINYNDVYEDYRKYEIENQTLKQQLKQAGKETARDILAWLKAHCDYIGFPVIEAYFKDVFGVEIKE